MLGFLGTVLSWSFWVVYLVLSTIIFHPLSTFAAFSLLSYGVPQLIVKYLAPQNLKERYPSAAWALVRAQREAKSPSRVPLLGSGCRLRLVINMTLYTHGGA